MAETETGSGEPLASLKRPPLDSAPDEEADCKRPKKSPAAVQPCTALAQPEDDITKKDDSVLKVSNGSSNVDELCRDSSRGKNQVEKLQSSGSSEEEGEGYGSESEDADSEPDSDSEGYESSDEGGDDEDDEEIERRSRKGKGIVINEGRGKQTAVEGKGKGIALDVDYKGKGKAVLQESEEDDSEDYEYGGGDLSEDPLEEVELDNILPSRTRRRNVQASPGNVDEESSEDDEDYVAAVDG